MTSTGDRAVPPPRDEEPARPANSFSLIEAGLRAVARRPAAFAVLWAAGAALVFATQAVRRAAGPALLHPGLSPARLGFEVLNVAPGAVLGTLALRLFLGGGRPWRAPDRGFWICAGLLMAADLASFALSQLIGVSRPALGGQAGVGLYGVILLVELVVQAWIFARLMLWPIGALAGEAAMTPGRSWRPMDGYVPAYVVAVILINLPLTVATTGYAIVSGAAHHVRSGDISPTMAIAFALIGPPVHLLERAMTGLLYRARAAKTSPQGGA
jgi:hypothetical protein